MNTQLWIGSNETLIQEVEKYLINIFCKNNSDCFCSECEKIKSNQHAYCLWIKPEKSYYVTRDIGIIFEKVAFALGDNEQFYFILNYAENLGTACSNKLLKLLEEPPAGYNFILLSDNVNAILPTIRSRSLIKNFQENSNDGAVHPLLNYFVNNIDSPVDFDAELKKHTLSEYDSIKLLNELFFHVSSRLKESYKQKPNKHLETCLECIKHAMSLPPKPGGSNIFWKNFYLSYPR